MDSTHQKTVRRLGEASVNTRFASSGHTVAAAPFLRGATRALDLLLLTALVVGALPVAPRAEELSNSAPAPIEQFKNFISSPPIIQNLVFQQKVPMDGGQRPLDATFALSTRFDYFQAKWQTNGMLFRRLNQPEDATNFTFTGNLVSVSAHQHALVEPGGRLSTWDDRDPSVAGKEVSVFYTSQLVLEPLRRILSLGIMYAGIGTVRWDANRLQTECEVDGEHVVITGELLAASDGPPRGLELHYAFPRETYDYMVRYAYAPMVKYPFLPAVITSFWLPKNRKGDEIEVDEYRILDFQTAPEPLHDEAFDVAPFAHLNHWAPRIYTNGAFYDRTTNGTLQLAYELGARPLSSSHPRIPRGVIYAGWAGLNFAIFALMLGAKETAKQNNKEERIVTL
jgi:hypothetical protein